MAQQELRVLPITPPERKFPWVPFSLMSNYGLDKEKRQRKTSSKVLGLLRCNPQRFKGYVKLLHIFSKKRLGLQYIRTKDMTDMCRPMRSLVEDHGHYFTVWAILTDDFDVKWWDIYINITLLIEHWTKYGFVQNQFLLAHVLLTMKDFLIQTPHANEVTYIAPHSQTGGLEPQQQKLYSWLYELESHVQTNTNFFQATHWVALPQCSLVVDAGSKQLMERGRIMPQHSTIAYFGGMVFGGCGSGRTWTLLKYVKQNSVLPTLVGTHIQFIQTSATLVVCGAYAVQHWAEVAKDVFHNFDIILLENVTSWKKVTYNMLLKAKLVIVSGRLLQNSTYVNDIKTLFQRYMLNRDVYTQTRHWTPSNVTTNSLMNVVRTTDLKTFMEGAQPQLGLMHWRRIIYEHVNDQVTARLHPWLKYNTSFIIYLNSACMHKHVDVWEWEDVWFGSLCDTEFQQSNVVLHTNFTKRCLFNMNVEFEYSQPNHTVLHLVTLRSDELLQLDLYKRTKHELPLCTTSKFLKHIQWPPQMTLNELKVNFRNALKKSHSSNEVFCLGQLDEWQPTQCIICCDHNTNCFLICGHSFCRQCVVRSENNCPVCKQYFHGRTRRSQAVEIIDVRAKTEISSKLEAVAAFIKAKVNEKCVVYMEIKKCEQELGECLSQHKIPFLTFGGNLAKCKKTLAQFQKSTTQNTLLVKGTNTADDAKCGLRFPLASHLILPHWLGAPTTQCIVGMFKTFDRQKQFVIHRFIAKDTVEHKLF
tara:strand:+ start:17286 stop:19550 length:2265 start_codon:yes stop_codon:yes gene_type:complete